MVCGKYLKLGLKCRTIYKEIISEPLRWLTSYSEFPHLKVYNILYADHLRCHVRTLDNGTAAGSSLPSMDKAHSVSIACSEVFLYESSLRDEFWRE